MCYTKSGYTQTHHHNRHNNNYNNINNIGYIFSLATNHRYSIFSNPNPFHIYMIYLSLSERIVMQYITKTRLYNFDPLKPHFYIVKLGLQGYTLFSLFLLKNIDYGYSLEPPRAEGGLTSIPIIYVFGRNMKYITFLYLKTFSFWL